MTKCKVLWSLETVQKLGRMFCQLYERHSGPKLHDLNFRHLGFAKELSSLFHVNAEDIQTANAQFETGSFIRTLFHMCRYNLFIVGGFCILQHTQYDDL